MFLEKCLLNFCYGKKNSDWSLRLRPFSINPFIPTVPFMGQKQNSLFNAIFLFSCVSFCVIMVLNV